MKDVNLNVRIASGLREQLENVIKEKNVSKSNAFRNALDQYIFINGKTKPALTWCFNELEFLLEKINDSDIKKLAEITSKNRIEMHNHWYKTHYEVKDPMTEISLKSIVNDCLYNVFLKSFKHVKVKYSWDKDKKLFIRLTHKSKLYFSKYLSFFLQDYFGLFSLDLLEEKLNENEVILTFYLNSDLN